MGVILKTLPESTKIDAFNYKPIGFKLVSLVLEMQEIVIVWFKRDLRVRDHRPLLEASNLGLPILFLYCFEPSLRDSPDWDLRHERFIWQSLEGIELELRTYSLKLEILLEEVVMGLAKISEVFKIKYLLSYQETGIKLTYNRDKAVRKFCKDQKIEWKQFQNNGVIRGITHRGGWSEAWDNFMLEPIIPIKLSTIRPLNFSLSEINEIQIYQPEFQIRFPDPNFQIGGEVMAWRYLISFFDGRIQQYGYHISKPTEARISCSRLSPFLAWGNLSIRQVYQYALSEKGKVGNKRSFQNFISRIHWHCHFIQKFETETRIESENLNRAFNLIRQEWNESYFLAWKEGNTGFPLVDACMKAVQKTGYLNFRMRSVLVSFLTHHLWLDWKPGAWYLATQFLDYEPGIHFSQFQMQAGTTGVNTIRIYNPVKQSKDHDPEGVFIKKWIPALNSVPSEWIHEPWKMSALEQEIYQCRLGLDYPYPIVNLEESGKRARASLWEVKKSARAKSENQAILNRLTKRLFEEESDMG